MGQFSGSERSNSSSLSLEIGVPDILQHDAQQKHKPIPVTHRRLLLEQKRPKWLREMLAEAIGVFIFVYPGLSSVAAFTINKENPALGSIFQIGLAFGFGIATAIMVCGPTSGGHLNPAVTISFAIWHGFPWRKVPRYIFSQVTGAFIAACIVVAQHRPQLNALDETIHAAGLSSNSAAGPGGILCAFPAADQTNYGYLFAIEFFACFFLGLVLWTALDPANPFVSPTTMPFIIGFAWANMIWGYGSLTISLNGSRDLGARIAAAVFYGRDAFQLSSFIYILASWPAIILATGLYELVLRSSAACIKSGQYVYVEDR